MKISINELRNLVRKAVATQIMESASKKTKTKKVSLAESKKISITELRSMIKEAIIKEAKNSPRELKDRETAIQDTVKKLPEAFKNDFQKKTKYTLEQLIEAMLSPTKEASKNIINNVKNVYPSLNFASVQALKNSLNDWISGSEKLKTSKQENEDEEPTKRPEPVYQTGEETYENISKKIDNLTKQSIEKTLGVGLAKIARNSIVAKILDFLEREDPEKLKQIIFTSEKSDKIQDIINFIVSKSEKEILNYDTLDKLVKNIFNRNFEESYTILEDELISKFKKDLGKKEKSELDIKIKEFLEKKTKELNFAKKDNKLENIKNLVSSGASSLDADVVYAKQIINYANYPGAMAIIKEEMFETYLGNEELDLIAPAIYLLLVTNADTAIRDSFNPETRGRSKADEELENQIKEKLDKLINSIK